MHALALIQQCLDSRSTYLDLGKCGLKDALVAEGTDIDKALRQCTHLKTLILSNKWYDREKRQWQDSQNRGAKNFFSTCPPALLSLCGLRRLICRGDNDKKWGISTMDFVAAMTELQSLDISYNQIVKLAGLDKLITLQSFYISNNQIRRAR